LSDKAESPAPFNRCVDERVAVNGGEDMIEIHIKTEIFTDELCGRTFKPKLVSPLTYPDDMASHHPSPRAVRIPVPAEYLPAAKSLVQRKRLAGGKCY
jgi:hypothetical protein